MTILDDRGVEPVVSGGHDLIVVFFQPHDGVAIVLFPLLEKLHQRFVVNHAARLGRVAPGCQEKGVIPPGGLIDEELEQVDRNDEVVFRLPEVFPEFPAETDPIGAAVHFRIVGDGVKPPLPPVFRVDVLFRGENELVNYFHVLPDVSLRQFLPGPAVLKIDGEAGDAFDSHPEAFVSPAVLLDLEEVQQPAGGLEKNHGTVLLDGQVHDAGQDEPILAVGENAALLSGKCHFRP